MRILIGGPTFKSGRFGPVLSALADRSRSMVHADAEQTAQVTMAVKEQKLTAQAGGQTILPPNHISLNHKLPSTGLLRRYSECASSLLLCRNRLSFAARILTFQAQGHPSLNEKSWRDQER